MFAVAGVVAAGAARALEARDTWLITLPAYASTAASASSLTVTGAPWTAIIGSAVDVPPVA